MIGAMPVGEQRFNAAAPTREKYRAIARIGRGGMADVMLAVLPGPAKVRKLLVLKRPLSFLTQDEHFNAMFLAEARIASRLNHPNVISTFEVGQSPQGPFIVMEYLEGQPLSNVFRRLGTLRMPLSYRLHVLRNLLAGLDYVHTLKDFDGRALRLVHRDVSPQNVFICYDGRVTLVDFGIAKAERIGRISRPGVIEGKIAYMAPEQLAGRSVDQRADIFSFGVILWETLTGQRITLGNEEADVIRRRTVGEIPDIRDYAPETPPALVDLCSRTLALEPGDRIQTAAAVMQALDGFVDGSGVRINDREVGQYIGNAFSAEREARRRLIESQMLLVDEGTAALTALPDLPNPDPPATGTSDILSTGVDRWGEIDTSVPETTRVTVSLLPEGALAASGQITATAAPATVSLTDAMAVSLASTDVLVRNHRPKIVLGIAAAVLVTATVYGFVRQSPSPSPPGTSVESASKARPGSRPSIEALVRPPPAPVAPVGGTPTERAWPAIGDRRTAPAPAKVASSRARTAPQPAMMPPLLLPAPSPTPRVGLTSSSLSEPRAQSKAAGATRAGPAPGESLGHPTPQRARRALDLDNPYGR
ncbi:MAG TPA: serine/threonine-protein kinase [Polyangia bacterium]|jgi:serine/threonine-protein kinase|nr:serine/threonine-protein kinase [Polyangia bacterium]